MVFIKQTKISPLSKKRMKQENKNKKKDNYKKKKIIKKECCICYNNVEISSDNMIHCGKVNHIICKSCKVQMKDQDCPMCRSHKIKQPIDQLVKIKIIKKPRKPKGLWDSDAWCKNPKKRRNYNRKHMYDETFHLNTNRLVRQRSNRTGIINQSGLQRLSLSWRPPPINSNWLTREQVIRYNGSLLATYDSASDSSEDSDTESTLSITDTEIEDISELIIN